MLQVICTEHPDNNLVLHPNDSEVEEGCSDWRSYLGQIYLHGKVEEWAGFDCIDLLNYKQLIENKIINIRKQTDSFGKSVIRNDIPDGIYNCHVYGYPYECKAYIWHGWRNENKGLIVDITDKESVLDAERKYKLKKAII